MRRLTRLFSRRTPEPAGAEPPASPLEPCPDPRGRASLLIGDAACLLANVKGLADDLGARPDLTAARRPEVDGRLMAVSERLEAICREVGGLRLELAEDGA